MEILATVLLSVTTLAVGVYIYRELNLKPNQSTEDRERRERIERREKYEALVRKLGEVENSSSSSSAASSLAGSRENLLKN